MAALSQGPENRLDSWKEIAAYLKRGVRTVQRWERTHELPVYRLRHDRQATVYAYRTELDTWWESRGRQLDAPPVVIEAEPAASQRPAARKQIYWLLLAVSTVLILLLLFYFGRLHTPGKGVFTSLDPIPLTTDLGTERWPTFSPDGNQVAYAWNGRARDNYDIYVKMIGSDAPVRLTTAPEPDIAPAWSPDGRQIAYLHVAGQGVVQIMVMPAIGGKARVIAEALRGASSLAWSPDGRWIVSTERRGNSLGLVAIRVDSGERRQLTSPGNDQADVFPAVAPDGCSVVFGRDLGATNDIFRLRLSPQFTPAAEPERLTRNAGWAGMPAFTPDGRSVVYIAGLFEETLGLWLLPLDAAPEPPRLLLRSIDQIVTPAVSRRHNRLVFSRQRGQRSSTWRLDLSPDFRPSGTPLRLIASTHTDYNAQYSPDGSRIVFHSTRSGMSEIWTADATGEHPARLTNLNAPITGSPRWSPDGKWIVFDSNAGGEFNVYRIAGTGGMPQKLTRSRSVDGVPSWSRDGRSIYFVSDRSGSFQVWKMSAAGSNARQITRKGGYLALESSDGRAVYYSLGRGMSQLFRVPAEGGDEIQVLPAVDEFHFCPTPKGLLFAKSPRLIEFLDVATGRVSPFMALDRHLRVGLAISTDQRHVLFSQAEDSESEGESDLMLVEHFNPTR